MALRQIRIGGMDNVSQYDDGDYDKSISVEDPIECTAPPVAANDVLRLADVGTSVGDVFGPAGATDSNIAEFNGVTGKLLKDGGLSHATVAGAVGSSHTQGTDTALGLLGTKNPPIDADLVIQRDSTAAFALVTSTWTQIKAFLKTYFDGLYEILGTTATHSALTTGVHGVGAGTVAEVADIAVDANLSATAQAAIAASHARQHSITDTSDHTSTATSGKILKADANGLPIDATNTDAQVSGAVSASHARSHAISSTSDHSDVNLAGLSNNDLMRWDDPSSKWLPKSIAEIVLNQIIAPHRLSTLDMVFNNVVVPVAASSLTIGTDLSERKMECVRISATGAETLTNFLGGVEGQIKILIFSGGNVTLTDGTRDSGKFYLNQLPALTDFVGADGDILALINLTGDGGATTDGWWEELWRVIKVK